MDVSRYWAFISYSHADEAVATWLHKALETYRVPRSLVGTRHGDSEIPRRLFPVFRDRDELASSGSLGNKLTEALQRSKTLIVIASRKSAASRWVNEEIRSFKTLGKSHRVLCLIVDGEPFATHAGHPEDECFAPALRFKVRDDGQLTDDAVEPIAADIRSGKDRKRDALLKLVAGVLDVGLDALKQRDQQRQQRRLTVIAVASLALAASAATLSLVAIKSRNEAQAQRRAAETQQQLAEARKKQAEGLIQFMLGDLRKKLEPIGKLDILDAVGDQAMNYFGQVDPTQLSDEELSAQAQALRQIGDVRIQQGKLTEASPAFREALKLDEEILRRHPDDQQAIFNVAQSQFYVGYGLYAKQKYQGAYPWLQGYAQSAARLVALDASKPDWQLEQAYATTNLGNVETRLGQFERARKDFRTAISAYRKLLLTQPENLEYLSALSTVTMKNGITADTTGHYGEALASLDEAAKTARLLRALAPHNAAVMAAVEPALRSRATLLAELSRLGQASADIKDAMAIAAWLAKGDSSNVLWRREIAFIQQVNLEIAFRAGDLTRARSALEAMSTQLQEAGSSSNPEDRSIWFASKLWAVQLALAESHRQDARTVLASLRAEGENPKTRADYSAEYFLLEAELDADQAAREQLLKQAGVAISRIKQLLAVQDELRDRVAILASRSGKRAQAIDRLMNAEVTSGFTFGALQRLCNEPAYHERYSRCATTHPEIQGVENAKP